MKTTISANILTIRILVMVLLFGLAGCSSNKKSTQKDFGRHITMPCDGKKYRTDDGFIRASHVARSSDITLSKEKSFLLTQDRLSAMIQSSLRSAMQRYVNERSVKDKFDFAEQTEGMILSSVNSTNRFMNVICEETFVNDRGIYTTSMTMEIGKDAILQSFTTKENKQRYFQLEEDMERFREIFEEETTKKALSY